LFPVLLLKLDHLAGLFLKKVYIERVPFGPFPPDLWHTISGGMKTMSGDVRL
jgi:hypothetical protein